MKQGVQSYLDRLSEFQPDVTHAVVFNTTNWKPVQPPIGSEWDYDPFASREHAVERLRNMRPCETDPELWETAKRRLGGGRVMSYSRRKRLPWQQRPRAWIRGWLYHWFGESERELADDNGEPLDDLIDDYEYDDGYEPQVIRTARVGGVYLPLSGDKPVNPWIPPQFTDQDEAPDAMISAGSRGGSRAAPCLRQGSNPGPSTSLTMWDITQIPAPWKPRTWPVILSGPRECAGRITALAGAW